MASSSRSGSGIRRPDKSPCFLAMVELYFTGGVLSFFEPIIGFLLFSFCIHVAAALRVPLCLFAPSRSRLYSLSMDCLSMCLGASSLQRESHAVVAHERRKSLP